MSGLSGILPPKHKVFISFHHVDEEYKNFFEKNFSNYFDGFVSRSVGDGDIDPNLPTETIRQKIRDEFIADSTVTIVLVGAGTWRRKHVDWEIASSIRHTKNNPRNGLLGILLPSYSADLSRYTHHTIPPRLSDNINCVYSKMYSWNDISELSLRTWIHEAFQMRTNSIIIPNNTRDSFAHNRPDSQKSWQ